MINQKLSNSSKHSRQSGFTLLEILVVMVIIGILTVIGLGNYMSSQLKARDSQRKQNLRQVANAVELYYNDRGRFPTSSDSRIEGCGSDPSSPTPCDWGGEFSLGGVLYLSKLPPGEQGPFIYESDGTYFKIYTYLENSKDPQVMEGLDVDCIGSKKCNFIVSSTNVSR